MTRTFRREFATRHLAGLAALEAAIALAAPHWSTRFPLSARSSAQVNPPKSPLHATSSSNATTSSLHSMRIGTPFAVHLPGECPDTANDDHDIPF